MSSNQGNWKNSDIRALTLGESHHFVSTTERKEKENS